MKMCSREGYLYIFGEAEFTPWVLTNVVQMGGFHRCEGNTVTEKSFCTPLFYRVNIMNEGL